MLCSEQHTSAPITSCCGCFAYMACSARDSTHRHSACNAASAATRYCHPTPLPLFHPCCSAQQVASSHASAHQGTAHGIWTRTANTPGTAVPACARCNSMPAQQARPASAKARPPHTAAPTKVQYGMCANQQCSHGVAIKLRQGPPSAHPHQAWTGNTKRPPQLMRSAV
jgi:hypothetical protein